MAWTAAAKGTGGSGRLIEVGVADRLHELTMPVDVVFGELDSADIEGACERIARAAPDSRLHRIPGAAHTANLDRPAAFAAVLAEALQRSSNSSA
jgi:pimeloyl-ACP methyl ester carboxylesterase